MARIEARYARALLALSREDGALNEDLALARFFRDALDDDEIRAFLTHPHIPQEEKYALFKRERSAGASQRVMGFLRLLIQKNRAELILPALDDYIRQADRLQGRVEARVVSARAMTQAQLASLQGLLAGRLGLEVQIKATVDPDVIGGFYILVDDLVFDATVRTQMNQLKDRLKRGGRDAIETR